MVQDNVRYIKDRVPRFNKLYDNTEWPLFEFLRLLFESEVLV